MKKYTGFIISVLVLAAISVFGISASAQTYVRFDDSGCIELTADTELSEGTAMSVFLNSENTQSKDNPPKLAAVFFAGENGNVNEKIKISTKDYFGKYYVFIGYIGADMNRNIGSIIIYDIDSRNVKDIIAKLNAALTEKEFSDIMSDKDNLAAFGIDKDSETNLNEAILLTYRITKSEGVTLTPRLFSEIYRYAKSVSDIKAGENADRVMKTDAEVFGSSYEMYEKYKAANTEFNSLLKLADYTKGRMTLDQLAALAQVRSAEFGTELKGIIEKNKDIIGIDMTSGSYAKLSAEKQLNVFAEMTKIRSTLLSNHDLIESFKGIADRVLSDSGRGGNSGSGGGGSIGSGGFPSVFLPQSTPQPQKDEIFNDIKDHFAYDAITALTQKNIISGYNDGSFMPGGSITRAEASKIIAVAFDIKSEADSGFADIDKSDWYYTYVSALAKYEIVNGRNGKFYPNENITREDMAVILARALKYKNKALTGTHSFDDEADISDYAKKYISNLAAMGIIEGDGGKFNPKANIKRGETAALVYRVLEKLENGSISESEDSDASAGAVSMSYAEEYIGGLFSALKINCSVSPGGVTKGDYILTVADLLKWDTSSGAEMFSDVDPETDIGGAAYWAVQYKLIPQTEKFFPDETITMADAMRILVNALGYNAEAEEKGGYPYGYMSEASQLGLLDNLKSTAAEDKLSSSDFYEIMYNMLDVKVCELSDYFNGNAKAEIKNRTILELCHKVYRVKGIVSANEYSYLYDGAQSANSSEIIIDNVNYICKMSGIPRLGYYIEAYARDNNYDSEIIFYSDRNNYEMKFNLDESAINNDGKLEISAEGKKTKTYTLDKNTAVIYNGKAYSGKLADVINEKKDGYIEVVKRKNDANYGLVQIYSSKFMTIGTLNRIDKTIIDEKLVNKINYEKNDVIFKVDGTDSGADALSKGDVIEYYESEDKKLYNVYILKNTISGEITAMKDDEIMVDNEKYKITDYFKTEYISDIKIGNELDFSLSRNGYLTTASKPVSTSYLYAYIINVYNDDSGDGVGVRMYTEKDKNVVYTVDDRFTVDGKRIDASEYYNILSGYTDKLVRYKTDLKGEKLKYINTDQTPDSYDNPSGDENYWFYTDTIKDRYTEEQLKRYRYNSDENETMYYKSDGYFVPYFTIDDQTKIFCVVNKDVAENSNDRVYLGNGKGFLSNDASVKTGDITAYNVDKTGYASAIVYKTDNYSAPLTSESSYGIVSNIYKCADADNETALAIEVYTDDSFKTLYVKENEQWLEKAEKNADGFPFEKGDVIRYTAKNGFLKDAPNRDFDAANKKILYDGSENSSLHYTYGKLYDYGDNSIMIIDSVTGKIKCYQGKISDFGYVSDKSIVSTSPADRLVTYRQSESECSNILLKCRSSRIEAYIVYE